MSDGIGGIVFVNEVHCTIKSNNFRNQVQIYAGLLWNFVTVSDYTVCNYTCCDRGLHMMQFG